MIAIRAFNVTVSQVRDQVSQTMIGEMRMKFWSDSLVSIYQDNPPAQPVAIQLHKAIRKHKLSKRWLQRILSSREEILNDKSFQNLAALETYSENSVSSLLYLVLECMNFRDVNADHAASHIGRAQGLITLLRAIPYNASKQRVYVPLDLLVKHNVSQQNIIRGSSGKNVKDLVFDIASTANIHLEKVNFFFFYKTSLSTFFLNFLGQNVNWTSPQRRPNCFATFCLCFLLFGKVKESRF